MFLFQHKSFLLSNNGGVGVGEIGDILDLGLLDVHQRLLRVELLDADECLLVVLLVGLKVGPGHLDVVQGLVALGLFAQHLHVGDKAQLSEPGVGLQILLRQRHILLQVGDYALHVVDVVLYLAVANLLELIDGVGMVVFRALQLQVCRELHRL